MSDLDWDYILKFLTSPKDEDRIFKKAILLAISRYGLPIAFGRHRIVFSSDDCVVKVPTSESGAHACNEEICSQSDIYAKTWRDPISSESRLPIVRMEWVTHTGYSDEPEDRWTWSIDCGQVGRTKDGRLVAYDWERY